MAGQVQTTLIPDRLEGIDERFKTVASDVIRANLADYLDAVIGALFPDPVAGIKEVIRRFLFTASQDGPNCCRSKFVDSEAVVAELKKIHPFSPTAMYEAICRISQSWNIAPPIAVIGGKGGSYAGDPPAADRYTTISISPAADAIFFKGINLEALPKMMGKSGKIEPKYFVPAIPMTLLLANYTIGFAYQSKTVALNFDAVCDLAALYARHMDENPTGAFDCSKYPHLFIPDFPTAGYLTNSEELLAEYRNNNFKAKIRMDGVYHLSQDKIVINTLPFGDSFEELEQTITGDEKNQNKPGVYQKGSVYDKKIASVVALSSADNSKAQLTITLKRSANPFEVWDDLMKLFRISGSFVPNPNYRVPDTGEIAELTYANLLRIWYTARRSILLSTKRKSQQALIRRLRLTEAQYIVVDHMDEVVAIIRQNTSENAQLKLRERFNLTPDQARALTDQKLDILSQTSGAELKATIDALRLRIEELGQSFGRIGEEIATTAEQLKKQFSPGRSLHIAKYIGAAYVDGGFIQFESLNELDDIAKDFTKGPLSVELYSGPFREGVNLQGLIDRDLGNHRYGRGRILSYRYDPHSARGVYTVVIKDGGASCVDGTVPGYDPTAELFQVKRSCIGLTRKGILETLDVKDDFTTRKSVTKGVKSDLVAVFPPPTVDHYFIIVINTKEPNVIHIQRVQKGDKSIVLSPVGDIKVQVVTSPKDCVVNMPQEFLQRQTVRCVILKSLTALLGDKKQVKVDLSTNKAKRDPGILTY